jgi:AcrR family transcriptional regulator
MSSVPETRRGSRVPRSVVPGGRRGQARGRATRERLLRAAEELFTRQGYVGTSIGDVAERAGVGVGTVYHHFPDKRALLLDLIDAWGDRLESDSGGDGGMRSLVADDVRAALRDWLRSAYQRLREKPSLYLVALALSREDSEVAERYRRIERLAIERLRVLIVSGQESGRLKPDLDAHAAAFLVHHLIEVAATQLLVHEVPEPDPERVVVELSEMISSYLLLS